jgi:MFS family permease
MIQHKHGTWILLATILGSSMVFIDSSVVNVALPRLQTDLAASVTSVQWVVEVYILFLAALMLVGGSLGDLWGRERVFAVGIVLFALSSVWCGLAPKVSQLIAARAVQGIGGALLTPGSLAIIRATFPGEQRSKAVGRWSSFTAITSALGPLLGGWLVQHASWRWIFFINVPLALVVLSILYWRVPESRNERESSRLDWLGALLAAVSLGAIVYGLIESNNLSL